MNASSCHVTESDMAASRRRLVCLRSGIWSFLFYCVYSHLKLVLAEEADSCDNLRLGQYPLITVSVYNSQLTGDMSSLTLAAASLASFKITVCRLNFNVSYMNISCVRYSIAADVVLRVVLRQDSDLL